MFYSDQSFQKWWLALITCPLSSSCLSILTWLSCSWLIQVVEHESPLFSSFFFVVARFDHWLSSQRLWKYNWTSKIQVRETYFFKGHTKCNLDMILWNMLALQGATRSKWENNKTGGAVQILELQHAIHIIVLHFNFAMIIILNIDMIPNLADND